MGTQFKWTDELVKEYARSFGYAGEPCIEDFKKQHTEKKKDFVTVTINDIAYHINTAVYEQAFFRFMFYKNDENSTRIVDGLTGKNVLLDISIEHCVEMANNLDAAFLTQLVLKGFSVTELTTFHR